jgi:hypothetical protein
MIEPWWPLAALAGMQAADAALCIRPPGFIRACLDGVRFPPRWRWVFAPIKAAAAAGLIAGIWYPPLAVLTCAALVLYFLLAVGAHVRARDWGVNLFVNASGMLVLCTAALVFVVASA